MPVYEFLCQSCGSFEERRSFEAAGEPMHCPECGDEARRVYSMPATRRIPTGLYEAMDRSEKSASEPEVVSHPAGRQSASGQHHHSHGRPWSLGH